MADLKQTVEDPGYDRAASRASKATICTFICSFLFMLVFSDATPGIVGGGLFVLIGIFAASLLLAMPLVFIGSKFSSSEGVTSIANVMVTIIVTSAAYSWLFEAPQVIAGEPLVVGCGEALPEFTLGRNSDPSGLEVKALCSCVWEELNSSQRTIAGQVVEDGGASLPEAALRAFATEFGETLRQCGATEL